MIDIAIIILVAVLVGPLVLTGYTVQQQSFGGGGAGTVPDWVNEQGGGVEACSYLFYQEGSIYYAKNQQPGTNRGKNQFSDSSATNVIQNAITAGGAGLYCFRAGTFLATITPITGTYLRGAGMGITIIKYGSAAGAAVAIVSLWTLLDMPIPATKADVLQMIAQETL